MKWVRSENFSWREEGLCYPFGEKEKKKRKSSLTNTPMERGLDSETGIEPTYSYGKEYRGRGEMCRQEIKL